MDKEWMDLASVGGSAFATVITCYFWLVRSRRERPDLRFFVAAPLDGNQSRSREEGKTDCHVIVKSVVANYSQLPDTLIRVRAWVLARSGQWIEARVATEDSTPLPINLAAMHSALVMLVLTFTGQGPLEINGSTSATRRDSALDQLASPPRIRVELQGLSHTPHTVETSASRPTV